MRSGASCRNIPHRRNDIVVARNVRSIWETLARLQYRWPKHLPVQVIMVPISSVECVG